MQKNVIIYKQKTIFEVMKKEHKEDNRFLILEVEGLNKYFAVNTKKLSNQIGFDSSGNHVFNHNSCYVHIVELQDGFHVSCELCSLNSEIMEVFFGFFDYAIKRRWKKMVDFFKKNNYFKEEDCRFYLFVQGDYSKMDFVRLGEHNVISYRFFVDNKGYDIEKAYKLGYYILDVFQDLITKILNSETDVNEEEILNLLEHKVFNNLKFLNKYYEFMFEELLKNDNLVEQYFFNKELSVVKATQWEAKEQTFDI